MGYQVFAARGGKEAVEIYKENQDDLDIVVLDMVMPGVGGGETFDRLKEINPNVRVLLASGFAVDGEAAKILERGCNGFIQKPFNMKELSEKIEEIMKMP
jgi:CheY-like chemotaxis protein